MNLWFCDHCDAGSKLLIIQPIDKNDSGFGDGQLAYVMAHTDIPFAKLDVIVSDWYTDLSPWEQAPVVGKRGFGAGAGQTLDFIMNSVLGRGIAQLGLPSDIPVILGGYSLAALFSLWCSYQTDRFAAVCAASPSVWFPGWIEYAKKKKCLSRFVYLSLGDREERTRNRIMASVAECIKKQKQLLDDPGNVRSVLAWNPGNHFIEPEVRTGQGFVWCMNHLIN